MPIKEQLLAQMSLPVIAAPMFIVSGEALVIASCKEGILGTFPALSARTSQALDDMLTHIRTELATYKAAHPSKPVAPFGTNLILHSSNPRAEEDLQRVIEHQVPVVIASVGNPAPLVEPIHAYGGIVFADVSTVKHARYAADAGVDGLILLCAGCGGHTGWLNPFAFVREVREFWDGPLVLAGSIGHGASVRAAEVLGADFVYMGSRLLASDESNAALEYKAMVVDCQGDDIVTTDKITGMRANFMRPSLEKAGHQVDKFNNLLDTHKREFDLKHIAGDQKAKPWKDIWCCGHGANESHATESVHHIVTTLKAQYEEACQRETH